MRRLNKVIFFSVYDGIVGNMLEKIETLLEKSNDYSVMNMSDLFEFHHVHQYFENKLYLRRWTDQQKAGYTEKVKLAMNQLKTFFLILKQEDLINQISKLEFDNRKNFWELFRLYEVYKKTDSNTFTELLNVYPNHITYILEFKQIVEHFNMEIRAFLLNYEKSAELLLSHFEESTGRASNYIFPKSLSETDKHNIITEYLNTELPNLNYIELIKNSRHLRLPAKILLKAKQKAEALSRHYFNKENSKSFGVSAALGTIQLEPLKLEKNGTELTTVYGALYLDSLNTNTKLFSAFNFLFGYTNQQGLATLISKETDIVGFESVLVHSKSEYRIGFTFRHKALESHIQLQILRLYLKNRHRTIEGLIEGYIKECLIEKYELKNLAFKIPGNDLDPGDKLRLFAPEMEYLLKQYKNYVTDGEIDHDLLQIDSTQMYLSDIPSAIEKKYVTSSHHSIARIQNYFFDPHGILSGWKNEKGERNLFEILMTERVLKSELEDYQQAYIDEIVRDGFLIISETGELQMANPVLIFIAGEIHEYGCMSYWHYSASVQEEIDKSKADGILQTSNKLFTPKEISYINYYLNKKEFSNSLDLRNKYMHGSNNRSIDLQQQDYSYFLRVLIIILLKLQDDLELKSINDAIA
ncbi:hypothetical protein [Pedobacter ginsengisoli]|uniref:hypothetical protein n=1 Tax=Pedobacter ginsengisoli TaxID=363852 RepID=UPI00254ABEEA|nr:hypothetical protein [Pedobacter ginsengisoli]